MTIVSSQLPTGADRPVSDSTGARSDGSANKGDSQQPAERSTLLGKYKPASENPEPVTYRAESGLVTGGEAQRQIETSQSIARRARDAFREACDGTNPDQAEASFLSAKYKIEELWQYAPVRDRAFRDLLALLHAALKHIELVALSQSQRDVLRQAFADLPKMFLDDDLVGQHIERFAEQDIDIQGPLRPSTPKRIEVTFKEID
ncbi:hypothetical protein AYO44_09975 [Planctomycetaceae bacterium SCGC AG-212-F19]|nr:hypothetical protein AYO44_09975 [Planctomycetaceae bacterium SCGC AG-212-F19]